MLVLSRKALQSVVIGEEVRITVVRVEGNQVRIGIEAPQNVRILRGELLEAAEEGFANAELTLEVSTTS
ncbi:carbon storage regulator [Paludisphaera rhizosphaerae]|uniref:carbon storage regulator n=1 Tax=Paludisphaera rhizosphaerae TaxID=2711216 RepID=UPI0013ECDEDC|nr:carbon storage regulator [Paludisphaera rhizosphaerae]